MTDSTELDYPPHGALVRPDECVATPPHNVLVPIEYFDPDCDPDDTTALPTLCPFCELESAWELIQQHRRDAEARAHRRHFLARRRWVLRLVSWCYGMGIIAGSGTMGNSACRGCVHLIQFRGRRTYVLGWPTWKWACLRRGHWPGVEVMPRICGICGPCPHCGSTTRTCVTAECPGQVSW